MRPRFVAVRKDGLGCRLAALVNSIALAEELGGTFEFAWPPNKKILAFHSIWRAEEIFTQAFMDRYRRDSWSEKFDMMEGSGQRHRDYTAHLLSGNTVKALANGSAPERECWLTGDDDYGKIFGHRWAGERYPAAFGRIEFVPAITAAIDLAREVDIAAGACALHLRGGDIVFSARFSNQYTRRVIPFPLAAEIGRRENAAGRQVLVFGQEQAIVDHVAAVAQAIPAYSLVGRHALKQLQGWFFETFLMARCARIVAGTSGFATTAARIAGTRVQDGYQVLDAETALSVAFDGSVEQAAVPDLHKAFAYWSVQEVHHRRLSGDDRLECLRRALIFDPVNSFYRLARVTILTEMGELDAARAELGALVEAEMVSIDWSEGCLRQILVGLRGKTRPTATRYTSGIETLATLDAPEALLCSALIAPDPVTAKLFADRFKAAEGQTPRARFYSLALSRAVNR